MCKNDLRHHLPGDVDGGFVWVGPKDVRDVAPTLCPHVAWGGAVKGTDKSDFFVKISLVDYSNFM